MLDKTSTHQQVQEMTDCYLETDPLPELSRLGRDKEDPNQASIKWLSLALIHGINDSAKKITLRRLQNGAFQASAKYSEVVLPEVETQIGASVFESVRSILHAKQGKRFPLSVGIRDASVEVEISLEEEDGEEKLTLRFPG